jgi:phage-related protein
MAITVKIVSDYNDRGTKQAKSAFGDLSKFAKMAGVAVAAAGAAMAKGLYEAAQAAAEDQKSFAQLENTMRNVVKASDALVAATDKQIGSMSMQFGIADDKLRPAFSNLIRATGSVTLSQEALRSAMDLSVATGKDLDSVSLALGKALNGQTTALVKMLPGLRGVVEEGMPAADILAAINGQVGGAAEANTRTFAGALERMKVIFGEMVETVGSWLLPALVQLADILNNYLGTAFAYLSDVVGPKVNSIFDTLGKVFREQILPVLQEYIIPAFLYLADTFYNKILPVVQAVAKVLIEKLGKAFAMIREKLDENREGLAGLRDFMDKVAVFVERYLGPALVKLSGKYLDGVIWAIGKTIDAFAKFVNIVKPIAAAVFGAVTSVIEAIVKVINFGIKGINLFIKAYNALPGWLKPFGDVKLIPEIVLPSFDLTDYAKGGMGIWGENRGEMPGATSPGGLDVGPGAPSGGRSGGRAGSRGSADFGPQAMPSLGQGMGIGTGWDLNAIPFFDTEEMRAINISIEGGLATSAEIGRAVVDAIKQYTNVSGPADIAVA